ncbi:MAG: hypothetical protein KDD94_14685, partial [Calditrichaeota bacterium]|nr:hypothetical protein [Calditrichota bacterium]
FIELPKDRFELKKLVLIQTIIQELRTTVTFAKENQIPCFLNAFTDRKPQKISDHNDLFVIELYMKNAVYSPRPRNIKEALDLRENPRIVEWRTKINEWATQLSNGNLKKK